MKGVSIKVTNNDLVIKEEDRIAKLYVIFKDKKYGTKYIIYTENNGNILYFGSPLVSDKKLVIMKFKEEKDTELVKQFLWSYLNNGDITNFEVFEIPEIDKLQIIDANSLEVKDEYINKLNDIFFKKEEIKDENKPKKKLSLIPLLVLLVIGIIGFVGYVYYQNNTERILELIYGKNIYLECKKSYSNKELDTTVNENIFLTFSNSQVLKKHEREINYKFKDNSSYYDFKESSDKGNYIKEKGLESYNDEGLVYKIYINYDLRNDYTLPSDYDELLLYYKTIDYNCNLTEKK